MVKKKKKPPKFTPLCPGCDEIRYVLLLRQFVKRAKHDGTINFVPEKWKQEVMKLEKREEHFDGCPYRGIRHIDFQKKRKVKK